MSYYSVTKPWTFSNERQEYVTFSFFRFVDGKYLPGQCQTVRAEDADIEAAACERNGRMRADVSYKDGQWLLDLRAAA